jgi:hypothetical protein
MTDLDLSNAASALVTQIHATWKSLAQARADAPDPMVPVAARATALKAENVRRAHAGVRVGANPDGFDGKHIAMLTDAVTALDARSERHAQYATDLGGLLASSLALVSGLAAALAAPERAAAARALAQATAEQASKPPLSQLDSILAKMKAEGRL